MATKFADFDLTTGSNDGSDWSNAWKTMADAVAGAAAGDVVLCKNTDSISTTITLTADGTYNGGYIKFVGVAASYSGTDPVAGNTGGTDRAKITSASAISLLTFNGANYIWLENFELESTYGSASTSYHGIVGVTAYSDNCVFINVISHGHKGSGFYSNSYIRYTAYFKCRAYGNSGYGWYNPRYCSLQFCRADNNSLDGFRGYDTVFFGCVAHENSQDGFYGYGGRLFANCVAYANTQIGINMLYATESNTAICCRSASNGTGIAYDSSSTQQRRPLFYYYGDNTTETSGYYDEVLNDGAATVTLNGTDTDEGFSSPSTDDYNLTSSATYRRVAVKIP